MADYIIPNMTRNPYKLKPVDSEVWINGQLDKRFYCRSYKPQDGLDSGNIIIVYKTDLVEVPPYYFYNEYPLNENDLVEIKIKYLGVQARGYITNREANEKELSYTALDIGEKYRDTYFPNDFNYQDEVTKQIKYLATCKQIAYESYALYLVWQANYGKDDFILGLDLESFPDIYPGKLDLTGKPLLDGLAEALKKVDYRYRIQVLHDDQHSIISAYLLGTGYKKRINRGTNISRNYLNQNGGISLINDVQRSVNASNAITHVYAEGDNRIIETALELQQNWAEVPDNFQVPDNDNIKNYVTVTERANVVNNWEKYTVEKLHVNTGNAALNYKIINPNYRRKYEKVGTHYAIPLIDDIYNYNDDPTNYPTVFGETQRQVKMESDLVQTYDNQYIRPFIVYKSFNDPTLYVKTEGFTVHQHKEVIFHKPFMDKLSTILAAGNNGEYVSDSYNEGASTSQYKSTDGLDLTQCVSDTDILNLCYLVLGDFMTCYRITGVTSDTFTVIGNVSDAGAEGKKGNDWYVTNCYPMMYAATNGVGGPNGCYQININEDTTLNNCYAGMYLLLGAIDMQKGFTDKPENYKLYRICYNSGKYLWIHDLQKDLTGSTTSFAIIHVTREYATPFESVWLNVAYNSVQKLSWQSTDLSQLKNKRVAYKNSNEYKWLTQSNNFQLIKSTTSGEEDTYTVTYNDQIINTRCDQAQLAYYALNAIKGAADYEQKYEIVLRPIDFNIRIGDQLIETGMNTGCTVTNIQINLENCTQTITASTM